MSELDLSAGFRDVDATGEISVFAAYLDALAALESVQAAKRRRHRLLALPGAQVLEVGCGTGDDVRAMGRLVGPDGRVVGLDAGAGLLAVASERTRREDGPVEGVRTLEIPEDLVVVEVVDERDRPVPPGVPAGRCCSPRSPTARSR